MMERMAQVSGIVPIDEYPRDKGQLFHPLHLLPNRLCLYSSLSLSLSPSYPNYSPISPISSFCSISLSFHYDEEGFIINAFVLYRVTD